jgi:hypothetical protein
MVARVMEEVGRALAIEPDSFSGRLKQPCHAFRLDDKNCRARLVTNGEVD